MPSDPVKRALIEVTTGDTIIVPAQRGNRVFVIGQVDRPGAIPLDQPDLTVIRILSLAGGMLGVAIGAGLPLFFGFLYDVPIPVSGASVGIAFGVSLAVGVFFGFYPARKAADMNIVDSLSYE